MNVENKKFFLHFTECSKDLHRKNVKEGQTISLSARLPMSHQFPVSQQQIADNSPHSKLICQKLTVKELILYHPFYFDSA